MRKPISSQTCPKITQKFTNHPITQIHEMSREFFGLLEMSVLSGGSGIEVYSRLNWKGKLGRGVGQFTGSLACEGKRFFIRFLFRQVNHQLIQLHNINVKVTFKAGLSSWQEAHENSFLFFLPFQWPKAHHVTSNNRLRIIILMHTNAQRCKVVLLRIIVLLPFSTMDFCDSALASSYK